MKAIYTTILLILTFLSGYSQNTDSFFSIKQNKIGAQLNPLFYDIHNLQGNNGIALALRYSIVNSKNISIGTEFSLYTNNVKDYHKAQGYNFGFFLRYTILTNKKIKPFVEINSYANYFKINTLDNNLSYLTYDNELQYGGIQWYVAPGVEFYICKEKISMDLMIKITNDYTLLGSYRFLPSFKINYHF